MTLQVNSTGGWRLSQNESDRLYCSHMYRCAEIPRNRNEVSKTGFFRITVMSLRATVSTREGAGRNVENQCVSVDVERVFVADEARGK